MNWLLWKVLLICNHPFEKLELIREYYGAGRWGASCRCMRCGYRGLYQELHTDDTRLAEEFKNKVQALCKQYP